MNNQLANTFAALADPTRFQVVEVLRGRQLSAGEIAAKCSTSGPAMSRHLRVLRRTGVVEVVPAPNQEQDARLRMYRLRREPFLAVEDWVDHVRGFWNRQLNSFKSYAEGKGKRK